MAQEERIEAQSGSSAGANWKWFLCLPALLFAASVWLTNAPFRGDGIFYAGEILNVRSGAARWQSLWDLGHPLWRPLGYLLSGLFLWLPPQRLGWTPELKIDAGLIAISMLAGLVGALLVFDLSRRLTRSLGWALVPTLLFVWAAPVLAYSQAGAAYEAGLGVLILGLWLQLTAQKSGVALVAGTGLIFGLASLLWLPYSIAFPAACCARKLIELPDKEREPMSWAQALWGTITASATMLGGVALSALMAGVRTTGDLKSWMVSTGHGMHQNRQAVRAILGCARLMFDFGADGVYLKRFTFHDPYAPVSAFSLFVHSLWKVGFFYVFIAAAVLLAWLAPKARPTVAAFALATLPGLFAAIVVFEPSSPERFLPVLPFLLLTIAAGLGQAQKTWLPRGTVCLFAILLPILNWPTFGAGDSKETRAELAALDRLKSQAREGDTLLAVTPMETAVQWPLSHPFEPAARPYFRVARVIDPIQAEGSQWHARVARDVLQTWREGRDTWLEKAALKGGPEARLLWVEGDDPEIHWRDVPEFLRKLEFDEDAAGPDGFLRISHSPANEALFREAAR